MGTGRSMGSHQSANMLSDEWLTPPYILKSFPEFDLDPCSPIDRPWDTAKNHFNVNDDGLNKEWFGNVWMNPPYGLEATKWMNKLADHGTGIALIFARTETKMFFSTVWKRADAVLFIDGRLFFHRVDGEVAKANAGAPSVLVAYGTENVKLLRNCKIPGYLCVINKSDLITK